MIILGQIKYFISDASTETNFIVNYIFKDFVLVPT